MVIIVFIGTQTQLYLCHIISNIDSSSRFTLNEIIGIMFIQILNAQTGFMYIWYILDTIPRSYEGYQEEKHIVQLTSFGAYYSIWIKHDNIMCRHHGAE